MSPRIIKIFLASPGDVKSEREAAQKVINKINTSKLASSKDVELKLECSDGLTPFHTDGNTTVQQSLHEKFQIEDCDLFVGIMWKSIGDTKPKSGTVQEYEEAFKAFCRNKQPQIWFYFRESDPQPEDVKDFMKKIQSIALTKSYDDVNKFEEEFHKNIKKWLEEAENNTLIRQSEKKRLQTIKLIAKEIITNELDILQNVLLFNNQEKITDNNKEILESIKKQLSDQIKYNPDNPFDKSQNLDKEIKQYLKNILHNCKQKLTNSYAAGNILNLLLKLGLKDDFSYFDLSGISIWNTDLQEATLTGVDFSNSDLKNSNFSEPLGCIHSIAFNANGNLFATGDAHGLIRIHDTNSFELCEIFNNEKGNQIWSVAFSSITYKTQDNQDSYLLASGGEDGSVKFFNIVTHSSLGSKIPIIKETENINTNDNRRILSVAFSPNGDIFASGGDGDNAIKLLIIKYENGAFNVKPNGELAVKDVSCMTFIDDNYIASGSQNGEIRLSDVRQNKKEPDKIFNQVHKGVVRCIAYNKAKKILASGGEDGNVKLFSITDQNIVSMPTEFRPVSQVRTLAFSEDGYFLAVGVIDNKNDKGKSEHKIQLWKYDEQEKWEFQHNWDQEGHEHLIRSVAFRPDSNQTQLLISGGDGRTVKFWNIDSTKSQLTLRGYANRIWSVAISRDGKTFACGGEDNKIRLWNYHERTHIPIQISAEHTGWVWSVAFSQKTNILASASENKEIILWKFNGEKWEQARQWTAHDKRIRSVVFQPSKHKNDEDKNQKDEDILASAGNDNKVIVWNLSDTNNPPVSKQFTQHRDRVLSLAFSPNGKYLASSSRAQTICLIDTNNTNDIETWHPESHWSSSDHRHQDQVHSIAFNRESDQLVSGGFDKILKLWKVPSGEEILSWEGHQKILSVAFHPTKPVVASAGDRHFITLWDISKQDHSKPKELKRLKGHKRAVESIVFSPDGKRLISCSQDQTIKFWDIDERINISVHTIELGKPYQGMNISGVKNLADSQISALVELGAFRQEFLNS